MSEPSTVPAPTQIEDGIWVLRHGHVEGNTGIVVGSRGACVIDTGPDAVHGERITSLVQQLDVPIIAVVHTHDHWDHVSGELRDVPEVFGHRAASPNPGLGGVTSPTPTPTVTFEHTVGLSLGDRSISLIPTPGHSSDSVSVLVDGRVLFGGDTIVEAIPPVFRDGGSSIALQRTIRRLRDLIIEPVLVPGHGEMVSGGDATELLTWLDHYIEQCRLAVAPSDILTLEDAELAAPIEQHLGPHLDSNRHHMTWRHRLTLHTLLSEMGRVSDTLVPPVSR